MKKILYIFAIILLTQLTSAQGCSDAGICSIGHTLQENEKTLKNKLEIAAIYGIGKEYVSYFSPYVSYARQINEKFSLSSRVTFSSATGNFGTRAALGDAYLAGNYTFKEKNNKKWSTVVGFKFPLNSANLKINGYSLPMDYQSSLGTFDLFLGGNLSYKKWDFNTAIQIPVINSNKNSYFKEYSNTQEFPSNNLFERKSDALFRTTYTFFSTNKKFTFKPNALFIYHLGEDSFENIFGKRETIKNSDGLTINANLVGIYKLNEVSKLELSLASPLLVREIRPDGLTRGIVASLIYKISF